MNQKSKAHLAVIGANLLFGINYSMVKMVTPSLMSSYALNVLRIVCSATLFWALYLLKPSSAKIDKEDIPRFLLCAICGVVINQILFVKGLSLTSTIHGSLLALGSPIFITAAAAWLLKEPFTKNKAAGLLLGVGGACLLVLSRSGQANGSQILLGDTLIVLNSISYALYFVWVRPLMEKYKPIHVIRWVFTIGVIFIIPVGIADLWQTDFATMPHRGWLAMSFIVIGGTFLPYLFNVFGIKQLGPGITGSYIYTQPFFAAIIGLVFLNEHMGIVQLLAGAMIAGGVLMVNRK
ncbi:MAG TPA: DMT family transporter [Phnomibacter sp.]|nr:DMT family transporter [Phnomibacter sp.]